jgi:hypothetical protein
VYVDVGTQEGKQELTDVRQLKELLTKKGYRRGSDLPLRGGDGRRAQRGSLGPPLRRELHFLLGVPPKKPLR